MRRLLTSRRYIWGYALVTGAAFLTAAAMDQAVAAAASPFVVAVLTLGIAYVSARQQAAVDFFAGFANSHGFGYTQSLELLEVTPLLGAGDRRSCHHYMEGELTSDLPGVHVGMAHYTYEVAHEKSDRRGRIIQAWTPYRYTIGVVELQRALMSFPGVFLSQRRGLFGRIAGDTWLDYDSLRPIELESSQIADKYELFVRSNQNRKQLMELFSPSFQVWLSELPLPLCFEFSGGTLVVYSHGHLTDGTSLEQMLNATATIAKRIQREGEPLRVVEDLPGDAPVAG